MKLQYSRRQNQSKNQGSALIIGLIFLLLMTIIGVSTMQSTTLSEKMAGNMRDQQLAFDTAEAALVLAESWIAAIPSEEIPDVCITMGDSNCTGWTGNYVYPDNMSTLTTTHLAEQSSSWWQSNAKPISIYGDVVTGAPDNLISPEYSILAGKPYVLIEQLGTGASDNTAGQRTETSGPQGGNTNLAPAVRYYRITAYAVGGTSTAVAVLQSTYAKRVTGGS